MSGWGGLVCKVIFVSNPTYIKLFWVVGCVVSIVFKKFDLGQDVLDLGDGLAVRVVATVVVLGEHLDCGLVGVYSGAVLG